MKNFLKSGKNKSKKGGDNQDKSITRLEDGVK